MVEAVALVFLLGVGGTLLLWYAIEGETDGKPRMDRSDAERSARKDTVGDDSGRR